MVKRKLGYTKTLAFNNGFYFVLGILSTEDSTVFKSQNIKITQIFSIDNNQTKVRIQFGKTRV